MVKKTTVNSEIVSVAAKYVEHVKSQGIPIENAYLFGSWAKGKPTKDSDIDICVVSRKFGKGDIDQLQILLRLTRDVDLRIEPIHLTPQDLSNKYSTLSSEIKKYGIRII